MYYDLAILFYILSFLFLLINFYFNKPILQTLQTLFTSIAILANVVQVLVRWQGMRRISVYALQDLLMLVTLSLAIVYLLIILRHKRPYVGFVLLPMISAAGLFSLFLTPEPVHSNVLASMWLYVHIPLTVIGTAFFMAAFTAGLMFFALERKLKAKKFGRMYDRLPPLAVINALSNAALYLGFAFYTAGVFAAAAWMRFKYHKAMGGVSVSNAFGGSLQNKIILVCVAWVMVAIILFIKNRRGMSSRQAALASVIGFAAIILAYAGVVLFIMR